MTSLRRLSVTDASTYAARAIIRQPSKSQTANHHYWASRIGKSYARSSIYPKNSIYKRWLYHVECQTARSCGSWTRRKHGMPNADGEKYSKDESKSADTQEKLDERASRRRGLFGEDRFFDLLRHDASAAYKYLQKELENDPYRWLYDSRREDRNPFDWLNRRRAAFEQSLTQDSRVIKDRATSGDSKPAQQHASAKEVEDFIIDPITMRKVPRPPQKIVNTAPREPTTPSELANVVYEIPIKKYQEEAAQTLNPFRPPTSLSMSKDNKLAGFANQPWLVKEGFTAATDNQKLPASSPDSSLTSASKLEPSLNRLHKSASKPASVSGITKASPSTGKLEYPPKENTKDDVDLLRASDIRAASGHVKTKAEIPAAEKQAKSAALNKDWQSSNKHYANDLLAAYNQVLEKREQRKQIDLVAEHNNDSNNLSGENFQKVKKHYDDLRNEIKQTAKILQQARRQVLHDRLALETDALKQVFDGFETRSRKQMTVLTDVKDSLQAFCDSTASAENTNAELRNKLQKLKRDAQLVAEVKSIYEDRYGKITAEHKQYAPGSFPVANAPAPGQMSVRDLLYKNIDGMSFPEAVQKRVKFALRGVPELDAIVEKPSEPLSLDVMESKATSRIGKASSLSPPQEPIKTPETTLSSDKQVGVNQAASKKQEELTYIYKILALDNASNEVAVATTTSSIKHKSSVPRSAAGILVHLDQPAKYFPYMETLDKEGFQLVSGSRTMLVYRTQVDEHGNPVQAEIAAKKSGSKDLNPLREEPVFSGHLQPRERLLRSYQLAHRRARAAQNAVGQETKEASEAKAEEADQDSRRSRKFWRGFASRTGLVVMAVTTCYMIGLVNAHLAQKRFEEGQKLRREEFLARRRAETQKNDWKWF